ncbi:unnamed protein product [Didymodactylos carnosus]|uniref:Uncharacterized protein n=1 Tax=Didymodactylos carnosus TaxID=1234261 RepID=A0A815DVY2_9BILA|nr:unnamed protein product [Didymodactylos carnosus]CAF4130037.1 unnamed protein product [Didymodactylos carnosus]
MIPAIYFETSPIKLRVQANVELTVKLKDYQETTRNKLASHVQARKSKVEVCDAPLKTTESFAYTVLVNEDEAYETLSFSSHATSSSTTTRKASSPIQLPEVQFHDKNEKKKINRSESSYTATLPRTTLPRTTLPRTTLPRTTLPRTTLPRIQKTTLPLTPLPRTTLPRIQKTTLPRI